MLSVDTVRQGPGKMIASTRSKGKLKTMEFRGTDLFCQEGIFWRLCPVPLHTTTSTTPDTIRTNRKAGE